MSFTDSYHSDTTPRYARKALEAYNLGENEFLYGVEVEKEDCDILESIYIEDFNDYFPLFRKESDGSLDDDGYELISPIFTLSEYENVFNYSEIIDHLNADYSKNCGLHINISNPTLRPSQIYEKLKVYLPVLYALNHSRENNSYCEFRKTSKMIDSGRYVPVNIHSNRIELRFYKPLKNNGYNYLKTHLSCLQDILTSKTQNNTVSAFNKVYKHYKGIYTKSLLFERTKGYKSYLDDFFVSDIKKRNTEKEVERVLNISSNYETLCNRICYRIRTVPKDIEISEMINIWLNSYIDEAGYFKNHVFNSLKTTKAKRLYKNNTKITQNTFLKSLKTIGLDKESINQFKNIQLT